MQGKDDFGNDWLEKIEALVARLVSWYLRHGIPSLKGPRDVILVFQGLLLCRDRVLLCSWSLETLKTKSHQNH